MLLSVAIAADNNDDEVKIGIIVLLREANMTALLVMPFMNFIFFGSMNGSFCQ